MKKLAHIRLSSKSWLLAAALFIAGAARANADDLETFLIQGAPAEAAQPAPTPAPAAEVKPAKKVVKQKETSRIARLKSPIVYPTIYPNPLAFNMTWVAVTNETFTKVRALANRQKVAAVRRAAVRRPPANAAAQNAIQQQMRKYLEPMLKSELSFVARVTDLKPAERQKLAADGKEWFEKFLDEFIKKQDPNQQQMFLQNMQGVWFGNQQQRMENPRDSLRTGVAKLVAGSLSKEKVDAYTKECRLRDEFARQVAVDNLVERIDEKVKLSLEQWKKLTKTLNEHWDKNRDPQLEALALNQSMWPGAPDQWVLPELTPAQQAVMKRNNTMMGQMFINGGIFGQMLGGDGAVIDDMNVEVNVEVAQPAASYDVPARPEAE